MMTDEEFAGERATAFRRDAIHVAAAHMLGMLMAEAVKMEENKDGAALQQYRDASILNCGVALGFVIGASGLTEAAACIDAIAGKAKEVATLMVDDQKAEVLGLASDATGAWLAEWERKHGSVLMPGEKKLLLPGAANG